MAKLSGVRVINVTNYPRSEIMECSIPLYPDQVKVPVEGQAKTPVSVSVSGSSQRDFVEWHPLGEYYPSSLASPNGSCKYIRVLWEVTMDAGVGGADFTTTSPTRPGPYDYYEEKWYEFWTDLPNSYPTYILTTNQRKCIDPSIGNGDEAKFKLHFDGFEFEMDMSEGFYGGSSVNQTIPLEQIELPYDRNGNRTSSECLTRTYKVKGRYLPELDGFDPKDTPTPAMMMEYVVPYNKDYIDCYIWYGHGMVTYETDVYDPSSGPNGNWYETDYQTIAANGSLIKSTNNGIRKAGYYYERDSSKDVSITVLGPYVHATFQDAHVRSVTRTVLDDPSIPTENVFKIIEAGNYPTPNVNYDVWSEGMIQRLRLRLLLNQEYLGNPISTESENTHAAIKEAPLMAIADSWVEKGTFGRHGYVLPNPPNGFAGITDMEVAAYEKADTIYSDYTRYRDPWTIIQGYTKHGSQQAHSNGDFGVTPYNLAYAPRNVCPDIRGYLIGAETEYTLGVLPFTRDADLFYYTQHEYNGTNFDARWDDEDSNTIYGYGEQVDLNKAESNFNKFTLGKIADFLWTSSSFAHLNLGPKTNKNKSPSTLMESPGPHGPDIINKGISPPDKRNPMAPTHCTFNVVACVALLTGDRFARRMTDLYCAKMTANIKKLTSSIKARIIRSSGPKGKLVYPATDSERAEPRTVYALSQAINATDRRDIASKAIRCYMSRFEHGYKDEYFGPSYFRRYYGPAGGQIRLELSDIELIPFCFFENDRSRVFNSGFYTYEPRNPGATGTPEDRIARFIATPVDTAFQPTTIGDSPIYRDVFYTKNDSGPIEIIGVWMWGMGIPFFNGMCKALYAEGLTNNPDALTTYNELLDMNKAMAKSYAMYCFNYVDEDEIIADNPYHNRNRPYGSIPQVVSNKVWDKKGWGGHYHRSFHSPSRGFLKELTSEEARPGYLLENPYKISTDPYKDTIIKWRLFGNTGDSRNHAEYIRGMMTGVGEGTNYWQFAALPICWQYAIEDEDIPYQERVKALLDDFSVSGEDGSFDMPPTAVNAGVSRTDALNTYYNSGFFASTGRSALLPYAIDPVWMNPRVIGAGNSVEYRINGQVYSKSNLADSKVNLTTNIESEAKGKASLQYTLNRDPWIYPRNAFYGFGLLSQANLTVGPGTGSEFTITARGFGSRSILAIEDINLEYSLEEEVRGKATLEASLVFGGGVISNAQIYGKGSLDISGLTMEAILNEQVLGKGSLSGIITHEINNYLRVNGSLFTRSILQGPPTLERTIPTTILGKSILDGALGWELQTSGQIYSRSILDGSLQVDSLIEEIFGRATLEESVMDLIPQGVFGEPPPESSPGNYMLETVIQSSETDFNTSVSKNSRETITSKYIRDIMKRLGPDAEINNIYKETLAQMINLFSDYHYRNDENQIVKIKCFHSNIERVVAEHKKRKDNIILPVITVENDMSEIGQDRRRTSASLVHEVWWDEESRKAIRVISVPPVPVDISYKIYVWTKYVQDMDQITEQIIRTFNPSIEVVTSTNNTTKAFLESEEDLSETTLGDGSDRILRKAFNIRVESYIPSPKFRVTQTGKIERFYIENLIKLRG